MWTQNTMKAVKYESMKCVSRRTWYETIAGKYENMKIWTYKSMKIWKYEHKIWKSENMKLRKYEHNTWKYENMKIWKQNMKIWKYESMTIWNIWNYKNMKIWKQNMKIWKYESMTLWKYEKQKYESMALTSLNIWKYENIVWNMKAGTFEIIEKLKNMKSHSHVTKQQPQSNESANVCKTWKLKLQTHIQASAIWKMCWC